MVTTLKIKGEKFVVIPEREYKRLTARRVASEEDLPALPERNEDGTYPAVAAARVNMARTIIVRRRKRRMSQAALARMAGIRVETLNRIERGKVSADTATIAKIDGALKR